MLRPFCSCAAQITDKRNNGRQPTSGVPSMAIPALRRRLIRFLYRIQGKMKLSLPKPAGRRLAVLACLMGLGLGLSNVQMNLVVAQDQSSSPSAPSSIIDAPVLSAPDPLPESQPNSLVGELQPIVQAIPASPVPLQAAMDQQIPAANCGDQLIRTKQSIGERLVRVNACDEIWLVNARDTATEDDDDCDCTPPTITSGPMTCARMVECQFVDCDLSKLIAAHTNDHSKATMIYVHGNRTDLEYAKSRALQMYENIFNQPGCKRVPVRLVIYAWKSESELSRVLPDFKVKSVRAYDIAPVLRGFLDQFPDRNLVLMGYSLGAQMILQSVFDDTANQKPGRYKIGLVVPSLDPRFLDGGESSQIGLLPYNELVESTDVFDNQHDRAIKIGRVVLRTNTRLIFSGRNDSPFLPIAETVAPRCEVVQSPNRVRLVDITDESSRCHSIVKYSGNSNSIKCGIRALVERATWQAKQTNTTDFDYSKRNPAGSNSSIVQTRNSEVSGEAQTTSID